MSARSTSRPPATGAWSRSGTARKAGLGTSAYPTKGFIYSGHAPAGDTLDAPAPSYQMASATHTVTATQRANAAQLATIQHGPTDPRGIFTLVNEAN